MYRKYTHHAAISDPESREVLEWMSDEMPGLYRKYARKGQNGKVSSVSVFCRGKEFRALMERWGHAVSTVTVPVDAEAEELILDGIRLDIRDRLYWDDYRYSVQFWERHGQSNSIYSWLSDRLGPPDGSYRLVRHRYFPLLYLSDRSQLAMIRLSEPPCRVVEVKRVYTHDEVRIAFR
jgi:hypothetical protein